MTTLETLPTDDINRLRREAILLRAASILAYVQPEDKTAVSMLLDDLICRAIDHGGKIAQSVYREAVA